MVCDKCKEREAVCEFAYGNQPAGARKWNLCEACLQQFVPGLPSPKQIEDKIGAKKPLAPGEASCGWVSFSPDERRRKQ
jgi:protein-arginine kinase activator protein McsA